MYIGNEVFNLLRLYFMHPAVIPNELNISRNLPLYSKVELKIPLVGYFWYDGYVSVVLPSGSQFRRKGLSEHSRQIMSASLAFSPLLFPSWIPV